MKLDQFIFKDFFHKKIQLVLASIFLLFFWLGARDIWTQEHRWASIVANMFFNHDFLHPLLGGKAYYDKPLLSYWLIALAAKINGQLTTFVLRIPSALAGLLALFSIYRLGSKLKNEQLGLLSAWMLLTTFYFIFWARVSSADMLNLAGSLFAVSWYIDHEDRPNFLNYSIFFLILVFTSLCKGLIGAVIPLIVVTTHIFLTRSFQKHFNFTFLISPVLPFLIYLIPFWVSHHVGNDVYSQFGLYFVYRENILRYFQPFDHKGPIYTYLIYLPVYLLPWTFLLFPALFTVWKRYKTMTQASRFIMWTLVCLFLFFTFSGSRRSYYILPVIPFAILFIADWLILFVENAKKYKEWIIRSILFFYISVFLLCVILPSWYYTNYGIRPFVTLLKAEAIKVKPWKDWHIVILDGEDKINFYLGMPPDNQNYIFIPHQVSQNIKTLLQAWAIEQKKNANTIFITRKYYQSIIQTHFPNYHLVEFQNKAPFFLKEEDNSSASIAFIPLNISDPL